MGVKIQKNGTTMNALERQFAQTVAEHKSTIYTVCYMFSQDADEVNDRAIVLLWLENLSYEEIGQIVGITAKNVSVRLFRIREQLKQMSND